MSDLLMKCLLFLFALTAYAVLSTIPMYLIWNYVAAVPLVPSANLQACGWLQAFGIAVLVASLRLKTEVKKET